MDFTGQHVVITGGSTGIGRATAARIIAHGGKVTAIARRSDLLEALKRELGDGAGWAAADVGDKTQLIGALDAAVAQNGAIDGLFLNAAYGGSFTRPWDYPDDSFEEGLRVNVESPFWAIKHEIGRAHV